MGRECMLPRLVTSLKMECLFICEGILTTSLVTNPLQYVGTSRDELYAIQSHKHLLYALLPQKEMRTAGDGERWYTELTFRDLAI